MSGLAPVLLCCDLDRTLIPNGQAEESPDARVRLARFCTHPAVRLAFVSGRDLRRVFDCIEEWSLPEPDFIIGDAGATIYTRGGQAERVGGEWAHWPAWTNEIAPDWNGLAHDDINHLFSDITAIRPQETSRQAVFKASYYVERPVNQTVLDAELHGRLWQQGADARLVWSVDETAGQLLLDVLPSGASQLHAMEFLIQHLHFDERRALFAGDSENDLQALGSHINGVVVANAESSVKDRARQMVEAGALADTLYVARGEFLGMNGNYAAGVLEGVDHFMPETRPYMRLENESDGRAT
ncbi:HAD-IIB family hydrolase [Guyparkeria sp. 1SP6A2]|nr:HAD-IIB family hydrolase [Guyparkeria sp. 1SP6A2]